MEDVLYTVKEVSDLIKCSPGYVYELIHNGHIQALKLGRLKIRRATLIDFLEKFEGYDLTDPTEVKILNEGKR